MKQDSATGVPPGRPGSDRVGVAVVGAGAIADLHLAALRASGRARLAGIVDTDSTRARDAARANGGVRWTTDLDEALGWTDCGALIVCTPNDSHQPIALRVAAAGRHLLVEKPLAITVAGAVEVREAFRRSGYRLAVAHTHRAYDYSRVVREVIESGVIGKPVLVRLAFLGGWVWGDWRSWVLDPARSGGHILHNGVHLLDTVRWWMGRFPVSVYARGRRRTAGELGIDDHLEMAVDFGGGRTAICEMSRAHRPGGLAQRDVLVVGTGGTLAQPAGKGGGQILEETGGRALPPVAGDAFGRQLDSWLDAIKGGAPLADANDGVLSVAMAVAADRSIHTGEPVPMVEVLPTGPLPAPATARGGR